MCRAVSEDARDFATQLFYAMLSSKRVVAAVRAFEAADGIDLPTLLVEIGTFITSMIEPLANAPPLSGDAPLSKLIPQLRRAFERAGILDDFGVGWNP